MLEKINEYGYIGLKYNKLKEIMNLKKLPVNLLFNDINEKILNQNEFIINIFSLIDLNIIKKNNIKFDENYNNKILSDIDFNNNIFKYTKILKLKDNNNFNINNIIDEKDMIYYISKNNINISSGLIKEMKYINRENYKKSFIYSNNSKRIYELNYKKRNIIDGLVNRMKDKQIVLTIAEAIYPPFGGGENWLLDMNKFIKDKYNCINICFKNIKTNENYKDIQLINDNIILMEYNLRDLIEIIKLINPYYINHQGFLRVELVKISNLLNIKMLTAFCFWNDLINFNKTNFNINMINNNYTKNNNLDTILNNSNTYLVSNFMNNIIKKIDKTKNIDIIESISHHKHYLFTKEHYNNEKKYVCLLNCHIYKGGQELLYLLDNLDYNIPILAIMTENSDNIFDRSIIDGFNRRNRINNINILYTNKLDDIRYIYSKCRILLIPSIVDETFCRVAYEGKMLNLDIISYNTGNLSYLLKDYNKNKYIKMELNNNMNINKEVLLEWKYNIEKIYNDDNNRDITYDDIINKINHIEKEISRRIISKMESYNYNGYKRDTIGIFCPFVDQGLGIQAREYLTFLKSKNYNVAIFSHKAYKAIQTNPNEWKYDNIYYSNNLRDNITLDEIINFVFTYRIKIIIIPEICFDFIYKIIDYFKCLNVKIITPINIEILRYNELDKYEDIDIILTNNHSSNIILKSILNNKIKLLEFNNYYMPKSTIIKQNIKKIRFITFGGLNSFIRKNIDKTYEVFYNIEKNFNNLFDFELYIMIQDKIDYNNAIYKNIRNTNKIKIFYSNLSYNQIIENIRESDIVIHLGDHEGLGLGFFEALNNNKLLITLDTYPNKEYIKENINGYLIKCDFESLNDNNYGITNRAIINVNDYYLLIKKILDLSYNNKLMNNINNNKLIENNYENNFIDIMNSL